MKVVVIGSGLIGVTTAYFLRRRGHEVMVIDRQQGPAQETSFANGGFLSSSMPEPWNAPLAVALGLTPRQHGSGGKEKLLGISQRGDKYIRTLLIHGARSALRTAPGKTDRLSRWVLALAQRSHPNVATTALANKMARVVWAMLRNGTNYDPERMAA